MERHKHGTVDWSVLLIILDGVNSIYIVSQLQVSTLCAIELICVIVVQHLKPPAVT